MLVASFWAACHVTYDSLFDGTFSRLTLFNLGRRSFVQLDKELLVYWIIVLISHASDYYARLREGELRASQAQLQALKMQLHPHFLFNALNSISALVRKDPEAADRMIARLGDFLRLTLEASATQEVLLRQELEFLDCYLEIERVRYHDRLTTRLDIDPQTLNCRVPNLILQPIVENAIRHGIAPRATPGHIEILAEQADGSLRIQVRDNGPGLPPNHNGAAAQGLREGLGLANTRARLAQLYGTSHRFELQNDARGGLVVTLELPGVSAAAPAA
jgi:LytS/YehU family sensor histidine kinase